MRRRFLLPEEEGFGGLEGDDIFVGYCKMSRVELRLLRECGERREGPATVIAVLVFICKAVELKKLGMYAELGLSNSDDLYAEQ